MEMTIKQQKKRLADAIRNILNFWFKERNVDAKISIINDQLMWFSCFHENQADLSLLWDFGIEKPDYYEERHPIPFHSEFAFFLDKNKFLKFADKVREETAS